MILKSLYLKNFRTYKGPEELFFASGDKNITIVKGNNEVGKTTIMNAITWCLYGNEYYKKEGNEPKYNKNRSYELKKGEEDLIEVKLRMVDSKGKEISIERSLEFYKNDTGKCREGSNTHEIYVEGMPVQYKNNFMAKHFPKDIRKYFLFDGEQLESYFGDNNEPGKIKKSVYRISQLDLLENIKNRLNTRIKNFAEELDELNPSLSRVVKRLKELEENIDEYESNLKEITKNLNDLDSKILDNEEKIKRYGENPTKLINSKQDLRKNKKKIDEEIIKIKKEYTKFLTSNFPKIFSINIILNVKELTKDLEEKGHIPTLYKKEFLKCLLEDHKCICGSDLVEGEEEYNKIKELYEKTDETTDISDEVNKMSGTINSIISNFPLDFKDKIIEFNEKIFDLEKEYSDISKQITDIDNILSEDDEEYIQTLTFDNKRYMSFIRKDTERRGALKNKLKIAKEQREKVKKEVDAETKKNVVKSDIESSMFFCEQVKEEIDSIYKQLEHDIHSKLEELTSREFGMMHWKDFYKGISIDKDYNVKIHKQEGDVVPHDLSKGGQLVLALSFMTALNSLSGFELPIIIDTPLGRLDEPIKRNIGVNLPIFTKNKQVTLLVTSSEYSKGFKDGIRDYIGQEYELKYIEEVDGVTKIEKVL